MIKFGRCRGFRVWKWGRTQVELWFCPRETVIPLHGHEEFDGVLVHVLGAMDVVWMSSCGAMKRCTARFLQRFVIPAGRVHGATVTGRFAVFFNVERWKHDRPTSAANDFVLPGGTG